MPFAINSETSNKQKQIIFPYEQCTAANQQWTRCFDCIESTQRPSSLRLNDPRVSSEAHMTQTLKKHLGADAKTSFEKQLMSDDYSPTPWMSKDKSYSKGLLGFVTCNKLIINNYKYTLTIF